MDYIIYKFTYGFNSYVLSWTKNSYVMLIFSIYYITYEFTYELNPGCKSCVQIYM